VYRIGDAEYAPITTTSSLCRTACLPKRSAWLAEAAGSSKMLRRQPIAATHTLEAM
jgi:hypothetical protein